MTWAFLTLVALAYIASAVAIWRARKPRKVCAWCHPGTGGPETSHGICERHASEMVEEARREAAV